MSWVQWFGPLAAGVGLGFALGWLVRSVRAPAALGQLEQELRGQLAAREAELATTRAAAALAQSEFAAAKASRTAVEEQLARQTHEVQELEGRRTVLEAELRRETTALAIARAEADSGRAMLEDQRRAHAEQAQELRQRHEAAVVELKAASDRALLALRDQFRALAAEALAANSPEFIRLANESFAKFKANAEGDLAQRQASIGSLVKPLEEQLRVYQQRLQQGEAQQQAALGQMRQQLEALATQSSTLSQETQRLRVVLSSGQARGRWGEETLRRVVEAAQLSAHCDFSEQVQVGDSKPDMVVRLPGERLILVDSKVPDLEFLDALQTADPSARAAALGAHARKLRDTIRALADRDYPRHFAQSLDYVVLFLPAESLFSAALEADRDLIVWAAAQRVLLATPASLIALLRSVAVSWQHQEQSQNARQIAAAAQQLYERVVKFTEHFEMIRDGLQKANRAYDAAVGSYERSVRPSGERLAKLGGGDLERGLADISSLDSELRPPPRTELPGLEAESAS